MINNFILQFSLEPGNDMVWTPWVIIRTLLSRDVVEKFLDKNPVNIVDENEEEAVEEAIQNWRRGLQAEDPNVVVELADFVYANIIV